MTIEEFLAELSKVRIITTPWVWLPTGMFFYPDQYHRAPCWAIVGRSPSTSYWDVFSMVWQWRNPMAPIQYGGMAAASFGITDADRDMIYAAAWESQPHPARLRAAMVAAVGLAPAPAYADRPGAQTRMEALNGGQGPK